MAIGSEHRAALPPRRWARLRIAVSAPWVQSELEVVIHNETCIEHVDRIDLDNVRQAVVAPFIGQHGPKLHTFPKPVRASAHST